MNKKNIKNTNLSYNAKCYLGSVLIIAASMGAFGMLQGIYIKELKFGEDFLGLLISTRTLATALVSFPCALFVNKIGKKNSILLSMFVICITIFLQGYYRNKLLMLIFGIIYGAASSLLAVTEGPFLMENSEGDGKIRLFSYTYAANMFALIFGYYATGHFASVLEKVTSTAESYRLCIIGSGIIGLSALFFVMAIRKNPTESQECKYISLKDSVFVFKIKGVSQFILYNLLAGLGTGLISPFFNIYLKFKINITTEQLGIIMALAQIAPGIGGLVTPLLSEKYGKINTIIFCQVASIPFLLLITISHPVLIVSAVFFILITLINMSFPVVQNVALELVDSERRTVISSIMNISSNISRAVSTAAAGIIMKQFGSIGYEIPYYLTAIIYFIAVIYLYKIFRNFTWKTCKNFPENVN